MRKKTLLLISMMLTVMICVSVVMLATASAAPLTIKTFEKIERVQERNTIGPYDFIIIKQSRRAVVWTEEPLTKAQEREFIDEAVKRDGSLAKVDITFTTSKTIKLSTGGSQYNVTCTIVGNTVKVDRPDKVSHLDYGTFGAGQPDVSPTPTPTATPTDPPVVTPTPTDAPTDPPVVTPTPTDAPTDPPVVTPTPTDAPTDPPVVTPTPTDAPTDPPVVVPTPTDAPIITPTPEEPPKTADALPLTLLTVSGTAALVLAVYTGVTAVKKRS